MLPTRRIFKNRGPSRRYQVAQNHKAQEKLGSSSTKAQRHAGHRRDTASQDAQKPLSPAHQELYSRSQKLKTWKLISKTHQRLYSRSQKLMWRIKLLFKAQLNKVRSLEARSSTQEESQSYESSFTSAHEVTSSIRRLNSTKSEARKLKKSQAPSGGSTQRSQKPGSSESSSLGPTSPGRKPSCSISRRHSSK